MSWSLNIESGDLDFVSRKSGAAVATGKRKAYQDIRAALLEPMGTDPMHPEYGSILDGGRLPNGRVVPSLVGRNQAAVFEIEEEITRIVRGLMDRQAERIDADLQTYGKSTISSAETIRGIAEIKSKIVDNTLVVRVKIEMQDREIISIVTPVS